MARSTLSIYGFGGFGANIVQHFVNIPDDPEKPIYPKTTLHVLDTSDSNIGVSQNDIRYFIVPGLEGAGKQRAKAHDAFLPHVSNVLNDHKPGHFNIVLCSGGGGSGHVMASMLMGEMLRRGLPTVCIMVGSTTSGKEVENTIKGFRSLQLLATSGKTGGRAVPMVYFENVQKDRPKSEYMDERPQVDIRVEETILQLALLFSGLHVELDRTDVINFLDHSKVSPEIPPQLVEILIAAGDIKPLEAYSGAVIGSASLLNNDDDHVAQLDQPYSAVGYISSAVSSCAEISNHTYITTGSRTHFIFNNLEEAAKSYRAALTKIKAAELAGASIAGGCDSDILL